MNKRNFSLWKMSVLAMVMLAVPMVAAAAPAVPPSPVVPYSTPAVAALYPPGLGFNPVVNYEKPNFAYSPNIRKFVDSLPGLGKPGCTVSIPPGLPGINSCNENNLGQYIPVAVPDTTTYPGDATSSADRKR